VVGPSGCGKTTTLRILAGLVKPTTGQVQVRGQVLTGPRRDVAIVFQDYAKALLPWRTAAGNVSLALEAAQVPVRARPERIAGLPHRPRGACRQVSRADVGRHAAAPADRARWRRNRRCS